MVQRDFFIAVEELTKNCAFGRDWILPGLDVVGDEDD